MFQVNDRVRCLPGREISSQGAEWNVEAGRIYTVESIVLTTGSLHFVGKPSPNGGHGKSRFELVERPGVNTEGKKMKIKWTKEMVLNEARKYTKRSEFARYANNAYYAAVRMGFLDEVCVHMPERSLTKKYAEAGKRVFIRYANRKLYDVTESKYVTLKIILKQPLGSFMVVDDKTKEDITNFILIQGVSAILHEDPVAFESIKADLVSKSILNGGQSA